MARDASEGALQEFVSAQRASAVTTIAPTRGLKIDRLLRIRASWAPRAAITAGAIMLGLVALAFASIADYAQHAFNMLVARLPLLPLLVTPLGYAGIMWATGRLTPDSRGSGIPQVIAASRNPSAAGTLISVGTGAAKFALTEIALLVGASVGREGPTVQIAASVMAATHRLLRMPISAAVVIAGGAAGVSAAFNTPLAGVAFAIEELASAYEQKLALLVMLAVMISGLVSLGIAGDYLYFGAMHQSLSLGSAIVAAPVAGVFGGLCGGAFSRLILSFNGAKRSWWVQIRRHPVWWAAGCGLVVALVGLMSAGATWGTGYSAAKSLIETGDGPLWFGPAKFLTSLLTALSGLPGGIFAPALATGAGVGKLLAAVFPAEPPSAIIVLGMIAYFVGVARAPLTAVIIVSEMTDSHAMILPLFGAAIIADAVAGLVCRERLYHGLSRPFLNRAGANEPPSGPAS